jgi:hypothetical protein
LKQPPLDATIRVDLEPLTHLGHEQKALFMDPLSTITTAIITAVSTVAGTAVKDGYAALKAAIVKRFGAGSPVVGAVKELEKSPESAGRRAVLKEELAKGAADKEQAIVESAMALLQVVLAQPGGKEAVQAISQKVIGHHNVVAGRDIIQGT